MRVALMIEGQEDAEHKTAGTPFPAVGTRMAMLAEHVELIHHQWTEGPFSFTGEHYRDHGGDLIGSLRGRPGVGSTQADEGRSECSQASGATA